jgi:hypothetical protein
LEICRKMTAYWRDFDKDWTLLIGSELMMLSMFFIVVSWIVLFFSILGFGFYVLKAFGVDDYDGELIFVSFWLGWSFLIVILQILHLFFSINLILATGIIALGLLGFFVKGKFFLTQLLALNKKKLLFVSIIVLVFTIWLSNRAIGPIGFYTNAGLYHLQTVKWLSSYPILPGLGNLNLSLAFNQSSFLYVSLLNNGYWVDKAHHLANGLLLLVFSVQLILSLFRVWAKNSSINKTRDIFRVLFLPAIFYKCFLYTPSLTPDLPLFLIGIIITTELCVLFYPSKEVKDRKLIIRNSFYAFYIIILALIGVTIKLSFIAFAGIACGLAFYKIVEQLKKSDARKADFLKKGALLLTVGILIMLPWMTRGAILSGYPVFPSKIISMNVDWKVPSHEVEYLSRMVRDMNYYFEYGITEKIDGYWNWLKFWSDYWFQKHRLDILFIPFLMIFFSGYILWNIKYKEQYSLSKWLFLLPAFVSVVFLFFYAPSPRFMGSAPFQLWFGVFFISLSEKDIFKRPSFQKGIVVFSLIPLLLFCKKDLLLNAGSKMGFYPIPVVELVSGKTNSGLSIYTLKDKSQLLWNSMLPCSMEVNPKLELREKGCFRNGFRIEPEDG